MESGNVHSDSGIFIPTIAYLFLVKTWFFEHWSNMCMTCTPSLTINSTLWANHSKCAFLSFQFTSSPLKVLLLCCYKCVVWVFMAMNQEHYCEFMFFNKWAIKCQNVQMFKSAVVAVLPKCSWSLFDLQILVRPCDIILLLYPLPCPLPCPTMPLLYSLCHAAFWLAKLNTSANHKWSIA